MRVTLHFTLHFKLFSLMVALVFGDYRIPRLSAVLRSRGKQHRRVLNFHTLCTFLGFCKRSASRKDKLFRNANTPFHPPCDKREGNKSLVLKTLNAQKQRLCSLYLFAVFSPLCVSLALSSAQPSECN